MTQATTERGNEYANTAELTETERHRLLSAERRRLVLDVLADRTTTVDLDGLAREVVRTADQEASEERVKTELHHVHLPKMADVGVVDYDPDARRVDP